MGVQGLWLIALACVPCQTALAADPVTVFDSRVESFQSTGELKSYSIQVDQYAVELGGGELSFGTRMSARYETRSLARVEEFGVAQFLRGCQYTSRRDGRAITRARDIAIPWREGANIPYYFPRPMIDGPSPDPLDWGYEPMASTRHYYYWWNEIPGSVNPETAHYVGEKPPGNPALYVQDLPGTAFYDAESGEAHNISLHFKTCLYPIADVPKRVAPDELAFAEPIHCFDWSSSWIYDHETGSMESPADLVEFCR